jgi:hypothetical protein
VAGCGVVYLAATNIVTTLARSGGRILEELKMPDFGSVSRRNRNRILIRIIDKLSAPKFICFQGFVEVVAGTMRSDNSDELEN